jgi:hypothetical protein
VGDSRTSSLSAAHRNDHSIDEARTDLARQARELNETLGTGIEIILLDLGTRSSANVAAPERQPNAGGSL